jgi:hypothetical protein
VLFQFVDTVKSDYLPVAHYSQTSLQCQLATHTCPAFTLAAGYQQTWSFLPVAPGHVTRHALYSNACLHSNASPPSFPRLPPYTMQCLFTLTLMSLFPYANVSPPSLLSPIFIPMSLLPHAHPFSHQCFPFLPNTSPHILQCISFLTPAASKLTPLSHTKTLPMHNSCSKSHNSFQSSMGSVVVLPVYSLASCMIMGRATF